MENQDHQIAIEEDVVTTRTVITRIASGVLAIGITIVIIVYRNSLLSSSVFGYPGVFLVSVVGNATVFLPVPSFAVTYAAGDVLNPYLVGIASGVGAAIGEMTGYFAGIAGQGVIQRRYTNWYVRLRGWIEKYGMFGIFGLALIPNPLFDVAGVIAGASKMAWWRFLIAASFGKSLRFIGLALFGAFTLGGSA
ncbi:MAG: VTT domain-containing protein [Chloroflexota bacterium]